MSFAVALERPSEFSAGERDALLSLLRSANLTQPHLEIGTAGGGTLCEMLLAYPEASRPQFVAVDTFDYFPDHRGVVERNLRRSGIDRGHGPPHHLATVVAPCWTTHQQCTMRRQRRASEPTASQGHQCAQRPASSIIRSSVMTA